MGCGASASKKYEPPSLTLKLHRGIDLYDTCWVGKMDPYVVVKLPTETQKTQWLKDAGRNPVWEWEHTYLVPKGKDQGKIEFIFYDKDDYTPDDFIGRASIAVQEALHGYSGELQLYRKNGEKAAGKLHLTITSSLAPNSSTSAPAASPGSALAAPSVSAPAAAPSVSAPVATSKAGLTKAAAGGDYPLAGSWDVSVPKPPVPDRKKWSGVYCSAPQELVEDMHKSEVYVHPTAALDAGTGGESKACPGTSDDMCCRQVMEFVNLYFMLQGRPKCKYGGIAPPELPKACLGKPPGLAPGHFCCQCVFAVPLGFTAATGNYHLMSNIWYTQSMLGHGTNPWMDQMLYKYPLTLVASKMPPRAERANLIYDENFHGGQTNRLTEFLYSCSHGPYMISYHSPKDCVVHDGQSELKAIEGNTSRFCVHPPPGFMVKGSFTGECLGGRRGLPGEDKLQEQTKAGASKGGHTIKVGFFNRNHRAKYQGCKDVTLVEVGSGKQIPVWVQCPKEGDAYPASEQAAIEGNKVFGFIWIIPKPLLEQNREYQCSLTMKMSDEGDVNISWTFTTFGPRVYNVVAGGEGTQSLEWALQSACDMGMKPLMRSGRPVPQIINLGPGEHIVRCRKLDPGAWLHIQGHPSGSTMTVEVTDKPVTFKFPPEREAELKTQKQDTTGYEYDHEVPADGKNPFACNLFLMIPDKVAEHDGGGVDAGGWKDPKRIVTMRNLTLRHNIPLVCGDYGSIELVDCHVVGPSDGSGPLFSANKHWGPKVSLKNVTHQPEGLFKEADKSGDDGVDKNEFRAFAKEKLKLDEAAADKLFKQSDLDKNGKLDRTEFIVAYRHSMADI